MDTEKILTILKEAYYADQSDMQGLADLVEDYGEIDLDDVNDLWAVRQAMHGLQTTAKLIRDVMLERIEAILRETGEEGVRFGDDVVRLMSSRKLKITDPVAFIQDVLEHDGPEGLAACARLEPRITGIRAVAAKAKLDEDDLILPFGEWAEKDEKATVMRLADAPKRFSDLPDLLREGE